MKTQQAIERAGSAAGLARLLGITQSAICQWGEEIPQARIWQLKALRPSWFRGEKVRAAVPVEQSQKVNHVGAANG
jgi:DNA-binding transcriptional regulator YdaS (Cro superfamily)